MSDWSWTDSEDGSEAPLRALVADDHEPRRRALLALLAEFGCSATFAGSAREAAEQAGLSAFDLVLVGLPQPAADQAARRVRASRPPGAVFVVRQASDPTSRPDADLYDAALPRPVTPEALARVVRQARRRAADRTDRLRWAGEDVRTCGIVRSK